MAIDSEAIVTGVLGKHVEHAKNGDVKDIHFRLYICKSWSSIIDVLKR